jgi:hypothetical protein
MRIVVGELDGIRIFLGHSGSCGGLFAPVVRGLPFYTVRVETAVESRQSALAASQPGVTRMRPKQ